MSLLVIALLLANSGWEQKVTHTMLSTRVPMSLQCNGTIHVDSRYDGLELGTPSEPFNTVNKANNFACDGARIEIQACSYAERVTFSKKLTIVATGGTVTIGR